MNRPALRTTESGPPPAHSEPPTHVKKSRRTARQARRSGLLATLLLVAVTALQAATPSAAADEPVEVMPANSLAAFTEVKGDPAPITEIVPISGNPTIDRALRINVTGSPRSGGLDGEYEITLAAPTGTALRAGDALLATFWARSVESESDDGAGYATFVFERNGGNHAKSAVAALKLTSEWQRFEFPFRVVENYAPGEAHVSLWLGYGPQVLELANVSVLDYGQGEPAGFPSVTYAGREAKAPWRADANDRIDQYRKGDLRVNVVDTTGRPVPDAAVNVKMLEHAFNFGSAASAQTLASDSADARTHRAKISTDVNQVTFGNDLKWNYWENEAHRTQYTLPGLDWLRSKDMYVHGHTLVWGSWGLMPPDVRQLADDPAALRARIDGHITDEVSALNGRVDAWDVVNEPYSEHNVTDILGQDEIARWFQLARAADPDAHLFLNEYDILEKNGWTKRKQDYFYNLVSSLLAKGAPIDALGIQGHFTDLQPTPPADLLPILDRFASLGLPIEITEFDIVGRSTTWIDEQLQADYTRDFLTLAFSHPKVDAVSTFGIWEPNIWHPKAAFYRPDWSIKPNGQAWRDLIYRQWWTNAQGTTNASGTYTTRGFLGDYLLTVTVDGVAKQQRVSMPTNAGTTVTVVADGIPSTPRDEIASLIRGGGFEHGTAGWQPLAGAPQASNDAHSGSGAVRIGDAGNGSGVIQDVIDMKPGTSYLLSAWAKSSGTGNQCYVGVRGGASPGQASFQYTLNYREESAYQQQIAAFTPPADTTWTQAFVWQNAEVPGTPTCTVDDVTLTETVGTPPPPPAPPFIGPKLPGNANVLTNGDLEQGSTTGWYCLGPCTLSLASNPTHGGSGALAVTNRGETWAGAARGVTVGNGGRYDASAWIRLKNPGSDTVDVALKVNTSTGSTTFRLGSARVTDTAWTQISASNVPVQFTGSFQSGELWISTRSGSSKADLLIDDASFSARSAPPAGLDLLVNGDAENAANNWYCFSPCAASPVPSPVHSGSGALRITNRTYEWAGPAQGVHRPDAGVALTNGARYKTSAWLRLADGAPDTTALIKLKLWFADGTSTTLPLAEGPITAGQWREVSANDVPVTWTGTLDRAEWWISTTTGASDLYVDDAALQPAGASETAVNPVIPREVCLVRSPGNTKTVYFGYINGNSFGLPVPVGTSNQISPAPGDRGQPVTFLPGPRLRRAPVALPAGRSVTWLLSGQSLTATVATPPCSGPSAGVHPTSPSHQHR
ncbi:endo-1,4-beta-xylanase [Actinopolymorpha alba]|uniref:endo-1,4-beta-xylanase n=1 Tax=Actinopolymorpha alba TaxID=533267 RepID=UPI000380E577|nr:endo-1,4-beta-xylanase [Actinopolymorpha alba]